MCLALGCCVSLVYFIDQVTPPWHVVAGAGGCRLGVGGGRCQRVMQRVGVALLRRQG